MTDLLQELLDKQAITERLQDYARGIDRGEHALVCSAFHPEAPADYGAMYAGTGHGFADYVIDVHTHYLSLSHTITNVSVRIDGDRAGSEAYVMVRGRVAKGAVEFEMLATGRYVDAWERRDGEWRIASRQYLHGADEHREVAPGHFPSTGKRDGTDPSLGVLSGE